MKETGLRNSAHGADKFGLKDLAGVHWNLPPEQLYEYAPGWDKYMLENLYIAWAKDKDAARNEDARFLGWVKS